ncbi:MAG: hypothetical protein JSW07_12745 [bacterium]|nr:MAG: hypothetical protein JSW07_12745 [bacterium]
MYKKPLIILIVSLGVLFDCAKNTDNIFSSFPDDRTVALWLFDETEYDYTTLCDAGIGGYDLRLMPAGHLVPGRFGNCLNLSGGTDHAICYCGFTGKVVNNHIRKPDGEISGLWGPTEGPENLLNALASDNWTLEFWLKCENSPDNIIVIDLGQGYDPGFTLELTASNNFELRDSYAGFKAIFASNVPKLTDTNWHHIAVTRSGSTVRYYLNGQAQKSIQVYAIARHPLPDLQKPHDREHEHRDFFPLTFEQRRLSRFNITIGHERSGGKIMKGQIDEMRFSAVVRYSDNFSPPKSFARKFGAYGSQPSKPVVSKSLPLLFDVISPKSPLPFGLRKYVFIDDVIVDSSSGVSLQMNPPTNRQEVDFVPKKSAWRPTVVDHDDKVYLYVPEGYSATLGRTYLWISEDGTHFTQHKESPVIDETPLYGTFFKDTNPDISPAEQFKLTAWVGNRGIFMYLSPDGVHWRRNETLMLPIVSGGGAESYYDDQKGRYVTLLRRDTSFRTKSCPGGFRAGIMFETSEPLKTWHFVPLKQPYYEGWTLPAVTCEGPTIFGETTSGQSYRTRVIKYPWADDVYLAFVWRFPSDMGDDPPRHVDLGVSRDGLHWKFFEPTQGWYIPVAGDPDPEQISIYGLIRRGNKIWQYTDHGGPHGGDAPRTYYQWTQRLDGFVSLDGTGVVITKPLVFRGKNVKLILNSTGTIKVAFLNEEGEEISGFGIADCDPIPDSVDHVVSWSGQSDVAEFSERSIQLKFKMFNSKLYAFELRGKEIE